MTSADYRPAFDVDSSQECSPPCHWKNLQLADAASPAANQ